MHRLVIALTTLLTLVGAAVVGGYLFVFSASTDRVARAVPADVAAYATVYLQPSAGQQMNLGELLGHVPGFEDTANLDQKIHEIAQQLLGDVGIDYEANVRPWLGNQLGVAVSVDDAVGASRVTVFATVKDHAAANAALERTLGTEASSRDYHGVTLRETSAATYALTDDLLVMGSDAAATQAALDAEAGRTPALATNDAFGAAMRRLPADHLAAAYLDPAAAGAMGQQLNGYGPFALALIVEPDEARLTGSAPFDASAASELARQQFALSSEPSSLADWMPADTQAELVLYGLSQTLQAAEREVGADPSLQGAADALTQLRALAALGLGINLDTDLLPLFDREAALAVQGLSGDQPVGQLLLRPSDSDGAQAALARIRDAVAGHGATVSTVDRAGTTITRIFIPQVASVAYAMSEGVVIVGLTPEAVAAAVDAHASDDTLSTTDAYRHAWEVTGTRGGTELYVDVGSLADVLGAALDLSSDGRDILQQVGVLALTAPAADDRTEIHLVLTAR